MRWTLVLACLLATACCYGQSYEWYLKKSNINPGTNCDYKFRTISDLQEISERNTNIWTEAEVVFVTDDAVYDDPNPNRESDYAERITALVKGEVSNANYFKATIRGKHRGTGVQEASSSCIKNIPCGITDIDPCSDCEVPDGPDDPGGGGCSTFPICDLNVQNIDICSDCNTPLVLDLENDGFEFGGPESAVYFDLFNNGQPIFLQWVRYGGDDAFLAMDINGNGIVDNGGELFGNGTRLAMEGNRRAPNGFVGLAQYDHPRLGGNGDGFITSADRIWKYLMVWNDHNADGVSTRDEISSLARVDVQRLDIIPRQEKTRDDHQNWLRYWAWAHRNGIANARTRMVDVYFRRVDPN